MEKVISQASEEDVDGGRLAVISDSLMFLNLHKWFLKVRLVSPCHCTSDDANGAIARILGERYVKNGSGKVTLIS